MRPQVSGKTDPTERKLSGTIRLFTGFVIGVVCALVPMYYYSMGRESALREGHVGGDQGYSAAPDAPPALAVGGTAPFASRMTYELSRLPEEPLPGVAKGVASVPGAAPEVPRAAAAAPRVADARPISAVPPDPRDRTSAIESEARKPEYREPPRAAVPARPPARSFVGRDVELKPETVARVEPGVGAPVPGVTAITRAPPKAVAEGAAPQPEPGAPATNGTTPANGAQTGGISTVDGRLAATRDWLAQAAKGVHTIQLMGASSEAQLDVQLKALEKMLEPGRIYAYRTVAQGKPFITVVYGEYADRKSALQALDKLPAALVANRPVLRTVNGIRAEMKQHKTDG